MIRIGLTGGIASGKTSAVAYLKSLGYIVIDADQVNHELMQKGKTLYNALVNHFGNWILNHKGEIDRQVLSEIIFSSDKKREELNRISHPLIYKEIHKRVEAVSTSLEKKDIIFVDIPLLYETSALSESLNFNEVWLVYVPQDLQKRRLMERDSLSDQAAESRISAQMSIEEKKFLADRIISNEGSLEDLHREIRAALNELTGGWTAYGI